MVIEKGIPGINKFMLFLTKANGEKDYDGIKSSLINPNTTGIMYRAVIPKGKILYRCRIHRGKEEEESFKLKTQIGYRQDKDNLTDFGRCNEPKQPLFYAAENEFTSILETMRPEDKGKKIVASVGAWEVAKDTEVCFVIQPYQAKRKHNYEHELGKAYDEETKPESDTFEHREKKIITDLYFDYMNEKYGNSSSDTYRITTAYANLCLSKKDGLIYRSVKEVNSYNVVFNSKLQDSNVLRLYAVSKGVYVPKHAGAEAEHEYEIAREVSKSIDDTGNIIWQGE